MLSSEWIASASSPCSSRSLRAIARPQARVHPSAPGGEYDQPPVPDLVAEALDHDRLVRGHHPGRVPLVLQVGDQVAGCPRIEIMGLLQLGRFGVDCPRAKAPIVCPVRPAGRSRHRARTGSPPAPPGAGITITRSRVISRSAQLEAPSRKTSPARAS